MQLRRTHRWLLCVGALWLAGCASVHRDVQAGQPRADRDTVQPLAVVEHYLAALNRRDLLVLTAYTTPDVEWYSMVRGQLTSEVSGRSALSEALKTFFAQHERTSWSIARATVVGAYVAVDELSSWSEGDAQQSRHALGVFEVSDGRIRRITYFLHE